MEYDTRVEVLNNRFQVLQEMLDMCAGAGASGGVAGALGGAPLCRAQPPSLRGSRRSVLTAPPARLRDHSNNAHTSRLEWVVIWLIVIEVVVGLFECASILGWVGGH